MWRGAGGRGDARGAEPEGVHAGPHEDQQGVRAQLEPGPPAAARVPLEPAHHRGGVHTLPQVRVRPRRRCAARPSRCPGPPDISSYASPESSVHVARRAAVPDAALRREEGEGAARGRSAPDYWGGHHLCMNSNSSPIAASSSPVMLTCRLQILEQKKKIQPLKVNFSLRKAELVKEKVNVNLRLQMSDIKCVPIERVSSVNLVGRWVQEAAEAMHNATRVAELENEIEQLRQSVEDQERRAKVGSTLDIKCGPAFSFAHTESLSLSPASSLMLFHRRWRTSTRNLCAPAAAGRSTRATGSGRWRRRRTRCGAIGRSSRSAAGRRPPTRSRGASCGPRWLPALRTRSRWRSCTRSSTSSTTSSTISRPSAT